MEAALAWIKDNWEMIVAILAILDGTAGIIPNKYLPYIGVIKRVVGVIASKKPKG